MKRTANPCRTCNPASQPPTPIPFGPVTGALSGAAVGLAIRRTWWKWGLGGALIGGAVSLYNVAVAEKYIAAVVDSGGIISSS